MMIFTLCDPRRGHTSPLSDAPSCRTQHCSIPASGAHDVAGSCRVRRRGYTLAYGSHPFEQHGLTNGVDAFTPPLGQMTAEISALLAKASRAFGTLRSSVFSNRDLSIKTKVHVYSAVVLSTLLYVVRPGQLRPWMFVGMQPFITAAFASCWIFPGNTMAGAHLQHNSP